MYINGEFSFLVEEKFDHNFNLYSASPGKTLNDVEQSILGILRSNEKNRVVPISLDTSIFDLGIDSIEAVDFILSIEEKLSISLDASLLWQFQTIAEISKYIYENKLFDDDLEAI